MIFHPLALCAIFPLWTFGHPVASSPKVVAAPKVVKQADIDITVLQFALTLEHLESAFYTQGLQKFSQQQFLDAGFDAKFIENLLFIASDEAQHVQFLTSAIAAAGAPPVAECIYNFPVTDVVSFVTLSTVLESIGTSAYLGGAPLISNKDILTAAGSILVTEALHTSLQRAAVGAVPAANAFGTPLGPNEVFTLAASFIVSCPPTNQPLPFTPFPSLSLNAPACLSEGQGSNPPPAGQSNLNSTASSAPAATAAPALARRSPKTVANTLRRHLKIARDNSTSAAAGASTPCAPPSAGAAVTFTAAARMPSEVFVTFISGLTVVSAVGIVNEVAVTVAIPPGLSGQSYAFVTKSPAQGKIDDANILFGPAILEVQPAAP